MYIDIAVSINCKYKYTTSLFNNGDSGAAQSYGGESTIDMEMIDSQVQVRLKRLSPIVNPWGGRQIDDGHGED